MEALAHQERFDMTSPFKKPTLSEVPRYMAAFLSDDHSIRLHGSRAVIKLLLSTDDSSKITTKIMSVPGIAKGLVTRANDNCLNLSGQAITIIAQVLISHRMYCEELWDAGAVDAFLKLMRRENLDVQFMAMAGISAIASVNPFCVWVVRKHMDTIAQVMMNHPDEPAKMIMVAGFLHEWFARDSTVDMLRPYSKEVRPLLRVIPFLLRTGTDHVPQVLTIFEELYKALEGGRANARECVLTREAAIDLVKTHRMGHALVGLLSHDSEDTKRQALRALAFYQRLFSSDKALQKALVDAGLLDNIHAVLKAGKGMITRTAAEIAYRPLLVKAVPIKEYLKRTQLLASISGLMKSPYGAVRSVGASMVCNFIQHGSREEAMAVLVSGNSLDSLLFMLDDPDRQCVSLALRSVLHILKHGQSVADELLKKTGEYQENPFLAAVMKREERIVQLQKSGDAEFEPHAQEISQTFLVSLADGLGIEDVD